MAIFRNIQNDGNWHRGGTYTIEVYEPGLNESNPGGWCYNPYVLACGAVGTDRSEGSKLFTDTDSLEGECNTPPGTNEPPPVQGGNFLFNNNNEDLNGGVLGLILVSKEDTGDEGWERYTFTVVGVVELGSFWLKHKSCGYNWFL